MSATKNLKNLGIVLPDLDMPKAAFRPYVFDGTSLIVSGQLPLLDGNPICVGAVPESVSVDEAKEAARRCAINILAWVRSACDGDIDRIVRVNRLGGFVVTGPGYANAPEIINAASEIFTSVFGADGQHARIAIGVASLPLGVPVEVEATFTVRCQDLG